eukprot:1380287-Rhodomonas_salina.5
MPEKKSWPVSVRSSTMTSLRPESADTDYVSVGSAGSRREKQKRRPGWRSRLKGMRRAMLSCSQRHSHTISQPVWLVSIRFPSNSSLMISQNERFTQSSAHRFSCSYPTPLSFLLMKHTLLSGWTYSTRYGTSMLTSGLTEMKTSACVVEMSGTRVPHVRPGYRSEGTCKTGHFTCRCEGTVPDVNETSEQIWYRDTPT